MRLDEHFFRVAIAAQDGLELARAERESTEKQAEQARVRLASGLGTVTQLHETEGRFALTQAREVEARNRLEDARAALKEIVGSDVQSLKPFVGDIDPASPEGAEILKLNRATRYIPTTPDNYKGIEAAGRSAGLI